MALELEGLLANQATARSSAFLEGNVLRDDSHSPGEQVNNYTLTSILGRGATGTVWLAHRSDGRFEGRVAMKFLDAPWTGSDPVDPFHREGSLLASLNHQNIGRLYDAGATDNGQPYLVLELIEGLPLDEWCAHEQLEQEQIVSIFIDVLNAVCHAHDRNILHLDLKPSNIFVTRDGQVKLLDFGIGMRHLQQPRAPARRESRHSAFTLAYAAPEQVQEHSVDRSTDVYALGVVLYKLLTNAHPTASPAAGKAEQLRAIVEVEARPLSASGAGSFSGSLERIVAKALKKLPVERYSTVTDMQRDLKHHLAGKSAATRSMSRQFVMQSMASRRALKTAFVGLVMAALTAIVVTPGPPIVRRSMQEIAARLNLVIANSGMATSLLTRSLPLPATS